VATVRPELCMEIGPFLVEALLQVLGIGGTAAFIAAVPRTRLACSRRDDDSGCRRDAW